MSELNLEEFLKTHPEWEVIEGKLTREYTFKGFGKAMDFMQAMRAPINELRHHPEWRNVYNRVHVALITHDAGKITSLDLALACAFDGQFGRSS